MLQHEIEEETDNIQSVGSLLGITITFLKEIRKDLQKLDKKLDDIKD